MPLEQSVPRDAPRGRGKTIAVFSYRYDAHLVPGLLANLGAAVQGWVAWDDRPSSGALTDEPARRLALVEAARAAGAEWILAVDPDERFERDLALRIGAMTRRDRPPALWTFQFCELFTPQAWRADGVWGAKRQMRLFPAFAASPSPAALHGGWVSDPAGLPLRDSQLRLYHLRMATPERRQHRRETYASADPGRRCQAIGYDYLADETGMALRTIEPQRGFDPPFVEDGGLWAPPPPELPPGPPDPPPARLRYIDLARRRGGAASALRLATALAQPWKGGGADLDLLGLAGQLALQAMRPRKAAELLGPLLDAEGADPGRTAFLRLLRAQARLRLGDPGAAESDLALLRRRLPGTPILERMAQAAARPARLDAPEAAWRRWTGPGAVLHEGRQVAASGPMAVVVIGFKAPPELRKAVASVLAQDVATEVVVVNTGGGDARRLLGPWLDRIRLICCEAPLYVGAARNIGIDASHAPVVAFLAADCAARPGWVAGRLARHRDGAPAVGNPVVPHRSGNLVSRSVNLTTHHRRHPRTPGDQALRYGVSYARWLFDELGYFPPGLRVAEDSAFNALVRERYPIDWAPKVLTTHRYPTGLGWLLRDQVSRGRRRAVQPPVAALAAGSRPLARLRAMQRQRHDDALAAARRFGALKGPRGLPIRALMRLGLWADGLGLVAGLRGVARAARAREEALAALAANPALALSHLEAAVALNPQDAALRLDLATALAAAGGADGLPRAVEACREAAAIAPAATAPLTRLCDLLEAQGQPDRALAEAEAAVARSPATAQFWRKASDLALKRGDLGRALFYGQGALALAPAEPRAHRALVPIHRRLGQADLARRRGRWAGELGGGDGGQPPAPVPAEASRDAAGQPRPRVLEGT